VSVDGTLTLLSYYQGHRGSEHMGDDKNVSRETSFAQCKLREKRSNLRGFVAGIAMNMATIRVSVGRTSSLYYYYLAFVVLTYY
jgi:hypothetical protein